VSKMNCRCGIYWKVFKDYNPINHKCVSWRLSFDCRYSTKLVYNVWNMTQLLWNWILSWYFSNVVGTSLISTIQPTCFFFLLCFVFSFASQSIIELGKGGMAGQKWQGRIQIPITFYTWCSMFCETLPC